MVPETITFPVRPANVADLRALLDVELGPTAWREVTQANIDAFADATGDHQWIHVDPARAAASPLGSTIAHGLLTLSLGPALLMELVAFDGFGHVLNYGYERVRFPAPLPAGSRLRMRAAITAVGEIGDAAHVTTTQTFECDGTEKPVCVAASVARFHERHAA